MLFTTTCLTNSTFPHHPLRCPERGAGAEGFTGGQDGTLFILRPHRERSNGRLISFVSAFAEEDEVLFAPNSFFRVHQRMGPGPKQLLGRTLGLDLRTTEVPSDSAALLTWIAIRRI